MLKTLVVMAVAILVGTYGDICISRGMKQVGSQIPSISISTLGPFFKFAFTNPTVLFGILLLAMFFILWLTVLSWAELSFVLPLTAFSYVLTTIFAKYMLQEDISPMRWAGTILIFIGVILVTKSY